MHQLEGAPALLQPLERRNFKALDEHRISGREAEFAEIAQQQVNHVDPVVLQQKFGVLELGVKPDPLAHRRFLGAHQLYDLFKSRHLIQPVKPRIGGAQGGDALLRAQRAQFGQREIFREPSGDLLPINGLVAASVFEFLAAGDIGGPGQLVLVARNQHQILGRDQIRLDIIRALIDRAFIGRQRVFGSLGARTAVGDDQHILRCRRRGRERKQCHQRSDQSRAADHSSSLKPTRMPPGNSTIGRLMMLGC